MESKFATYANGDISSESLIASRDHRALAGLSRCSMAVYNWYNGGGTEDFALENHTKFNANVLFRLPGWFIEGENYAFVIKEGSGHTYESWLTDLYNSRMVFFQ